MPYDCVYHAIANCTGSTVDEIKEEFDYERRSPLPDGRPRPPSLHEIVDHFMEVGGSLTPIERFPKSTHGGLTLNDMSDLKAKDRWRTYVEEYEGLLVGERGGVGHMAYDDHGTIWDGYRRYLIHQCEDNGFTPTVLWVLTWQA